MKCIVAVNAPDIVVHIVGRILQKMIRGQVGNICSLHYCRASFKRFDLRVGRTETMSVQGIDQEFGLQMVVHLNT